MTKSAQRWPENCIAVAVGEDPARSMVPLAFGGHGIWVRRCLQEAGEIILPEVTEDASLWLTVLAVGPNCGQKVSKAHARRWRRALVRAYGIEKARLSPALPSDIIGKQVFVPLPWPRVDERVTTPYPRRHDELIIEETLPEAISN